MQPAGEDFHLIDVASQAYAVQQLLQGRPTEAKLAWLAQRSHVSLQHHGGVFPDTYLFRSHLGLETLFFFQAGDFVFVGDHTTWVARPTDHYHA